MAILNPQPVVINGVSYPNLGFDLAMATRISDNRMKLNINAFLWPYRDTETGPEILIVPPGLASLQIPPIIYADAQLAAAQGDTPMEEFLAALEFISQRLLNKKAGMAE
jgi:hypothetical protein